MVPVTSNLPMLLLGGTLCDERVFAPLRERLPGYQIVVGDMTGGWSASAQAERVLARAPPQFALAGFSLGGIVALEMIAQSPDRIERLALLGTTARPDPEDNAALRRGWVERAQSMGAASYIEDSWPTPVAPANAENGELRALLADMAARAGAGVLASQSEVAIRRADSRPRLHRIAVPTLVVCGAHDAMCPPEVHREIADLIPQATLAIIPDAGHFALLENPDAVATHLGAWLVLPSTLEPPRSVVALQEQT